MFIARFKQLVTAAELDIDSHGVIELLKQGLKTALVQNVLNAPDYDPNGTYTFAEMEKRIHDSHLRWLNSQAYKRQDQKQRFLTVLGIRPRTGGQTRNRGQPFKGGHRTTSQGGDAMDVDITETTEIDTTRTNQRRNNECFYCQKPGHFAKDCRKKKSDHAQAEGSGGNQRNSNVKTADLIDFSTMTTDQHTDMLTKYVQSDAFLAQEDDKKLKFIEKIAPQGF